MSVHGRKKTVILSVVSKILTAMLAAYLCWLYLGLSTLILPDSTSDVLHFTSNITQRKLLQGQSTDYEGLLTVKIAVKAIAPFQMLLQACLLFWFPLLKTSDRASKLIFISISIFWSKRVGKHLMSLMSWLMEGGVCDKKGDSCPSISLSVKSEIGMAIILACF